MAVRRTNDDPIAREVAATKLADLLESTVDGPAGNGGLSVHQLTETLFDSVEFETTTSKVAGREIRLRRLVAVTEWEVDPSQGR